MVYRLLLNVSLFSRVDVESCWTRRGEETLVVGQSSTLFNVLKQSENLAVGAETKLVTALEEAQLDHEEEAQQAALGLLNQLGSRNSSTT